MPGNRTGVVHMSKIVSAVEKFLSAQPHWSWEG
jgi:hypothetical protein